MQNPVNQNNDKYSDLTKQQRQELTKITQQISNVIQPVYNNEFDSRGRNIKHIFEKKLSLHHSGFTDWLSLDLDKQASKKLDEKWTNFWKTNTIIKFPRNSFLYYSLIDPEGVDSTDLYDSNYEKFVDDKVVYFCVPIKILNNKALFIQNIMEQHRMLRMDLVYKYHSINYLMYRLLNPKLSFHNALLWIIIPCAILLVIILFVIAIFVH